MDQTNPVYPLQKGSCSQLGEAHRLRLDGVGPTNGVKPRLIVNADDLGMSPSVNSAIIWSFKNGLVTSASVMPNMPSFGDACELVRRHHLHGRIGVHLNLCEGRPLTHEIRDQRRFCDSRGFFHSKKRVPWLHPKERKALRRELEAQILACIRQGIRPSHLDSHHHYHTEWPIGSIVIRLAHKHRIPAIRLTRNCGPRLGVLKRLYKSLFNFRIWLNGLTQTRYFGGAEDVVHLRSWVRSPVEVMVHPRLSPDGSVTDMEEGRGLRFIVEDLTRLGFGTP